MRPPKLIRTVLSTLLVSFFLLPVSAKEVEDLIQDLQGEDQASRVHAYQMLPTTGVETIPQLIPLLQHEDFSVRKTTHDVLFNLINEACAPGKKHERATAARYLRELIDGDKDRSLQIAGIKLLALTAPPGFDLSFFEPYLQKPRFREITRVSLQRMNTEAARQILREALSHYANEENEDEFTCALIHSLGDLHDREVLPLLEKLASHDSPSIQAAAIQALSWSGDPQYTQTLWKAATNVTDSQARREIWDGLVKYANAMEREHPGKARDLYKEMLYMTFGSQTSAALVGLGRVGDRSCVYPIINVLISERPNAQISAANALANMPGKAITEEIVSHYRKGPEELQALLLPILGARHDPALFPLLEEASQSEYWPARQTSYEALAELGDPRAIPILEKALDHDWPDDRQISRSSIKHLADRLLEQDKNEAASEIYRILYNKALDEEEKQMALKGIAKYPTSEAIDILLEHSQEESLSTEMLKPIAMTILQLVQKETPFQEKKASKVLQLLQTLYTECTRDQVQNLVNSLQDQGEDLPYSMLLGFIQRWYVIGPFPLPSEEHWQMEYLDEPEVDLERSYRLHGKRHEWEPVWAHPQEGIVDLVSTLSMCEQCLAYAYTEIYVPEACEAVLSLGVDDSEQVWVNGEKVFEQYTARPLQKDQDTVPIQLEKGENQILLKIYQNNLDWEFCARVLSSEDKILPFVQSMD